MYFCLLEKQDNIPRKIVTFCSVSVIYTNLDTCMIVHSIFRTVSKYTCLYPYAQCEKVTLKYIELFGVKNM